MADPSRDLAATVAQIDERWDAQRSERNRLALHDKRARALRNRRRLGAVSALAALALLGFGAYLYRAPRVAAPVATRAPANGLLSLARGPARFDPSHMQLADGSQVFMQDAQARVQIQEVSPVRVELALLAGSARFDVTRPASPRLFRVHAGAVTVEVLGTSFVLTREGARTHVAVVEGRVAVLWPAGRSELSAGQADWFPPTPRAPEASGEPARAEPPATSSHRAAQRATAQRARPSWREPAEQGDFERAYELLSKSEKPRADDVEELLLAADAARLSGHPAAALPYLKQVISQHASDSRASLAAFTLGGVLMQQLGQPREAEAAYARARALSLNASLAEDALARQVEAAHRAADSALARSLAREYLERYPKGRRIGAVQRFGGLSP